MVTSNLVKQSSKPRAAIPRSALPWFVLQKDVSTVEFCRASLFCIETSLLAAVNEYPGTRIAIRVSLFLQFCSPSVASPDPFVSVMSEAFSVERRKIIRFLGGKVILVNPAFKGTGMLIKAKAMAEKHDMFWTNQFENEANAWIHEQTTAPELVGPGGAFDASGDTKLDHFVLAYGTGGTLLGTGRYFKKLSPATKIHVCEPSNAPMMYSEIPSVYPDDGPLVSEAHPVWRPHLFQGWAADFVPKLVGQAQKELDFRYCICFCLLDCPGCKHGLSLFLTSTVSTILYIVTPSPSFVPELCRLFGAVCFCLHHGQNHSRRWL